MLLAAPECIIVSPIEEKSKIDLGIKTRGRIIRGKVLSVGLSLPTPSGDTIIPPFKKGDEVWFLSYEGDYDNALMADNEKLYFVQFKDVRAYK